MSNNDLPIIPDTVYKMRTLRRLDVSGNQLADVSHLIGDLDQLVTLNLSRNKLLALPVSIPYLQYWFKCI